MADPIEERFAGLEARIAQLERRRLPVLAARRAVADGALEAKLGTYWLSRIGIVSLITGAALLIVTYFGSLGPLVRVGLGYAMAAFVTWSGRRLARTHKTFGEIVFGGGLAIGYFATYALHFVRVLRVVDSEPIGVALVAIAIAVIVAIAHRMRSETVAGIALFLGLHTGMLSEVTALSLIATTLLAAGAGFFLAVNRWVIVPLSTVIAVYSTHAVLALGAAVSPEVRAAFLAVDFALFSAALLIGPSTATRSLVLLGVLNWLGALVLGGYTIAAISRDAVFAGACGFAVVLAVLAGIARVRRAPHAIVASQLCLAFVTAALALPVKLVGGPLLVGWLGLALIATWVARRSAPRFAVLALLLVLASYGEAWRHHDGALAVLACVLVMIAVERGHAGAAESSVRGGVLADARPGSDAAAWPARDVVLLGERADAGAAESPARDVVLVGERGADASDSPVLGVARVSERGADASDSPVRGVARVSERGGVGAAESPARDVVLVGERGGVGAAASSVRGVARVSERGGVGAAESSVRGAPIVGERGGIGAAESSVRGAAIAGERGSVGAAESSVGGVVVVGERGGVGAALSSVRGAAIVGERGGVGAAASSVRGAAIVGERGAHASDSAVRGVVIADVCGAHASGSPVRGFIIAGVAAGLLQLALAALPAGYHTVGWVGAAVVLFALGFALRVMTYRWAAFVVLGLTACRLLAVELPRFSPNQRIVTFVLAGLALLVVSYVYARRERRGSRGGS